MGVIVKFPWVKAMFKNQRNTNQIVKLDDKKYYQVATAITSGMLANLVAIPFSTIFVDAALLTTSQKKPLPLYSIAALHTNMLRNLITNTQYVYRGGLARTGQKIITSVAGKLLAEKYAIPNALSHQEKLLYTMLRSGIGGLIISPVTNLFKFLQNNKITGISYPKTTLFLFTKENIIWPYP